MSYSHYDYNEKSTGFLRGLIERLFGCADSADPKSETSLKIMKIEKVIGGRGDSIPGRNNCSPSSNVPRQWIDPKGS